MPRLALLLPLVATVACHAPAYLSFTSHAGSESTSTGESSSTGDDSTSLPPVMSTIGSESSGANSSTGDPPDDSGTSGTSGTASTASTASTSASTGLAPVCGDGVVEGDEECDDANQIDDDRCANNCTKNRWIFASAANDHQGALGGVEGAHSRCRQYALQSGKADDTWMTFVAWISDTDHDIRDTLYPGLGRYVRTDGEVVADSYEQLFSGTLNAPILVDEHGDPAPGGALTGTRFDGTAVPGTHCENWTTKTGLDVSLYYGSTAATDSWWTWADAPDANPGPCSIKRRLYCIEGE